MSKSLGITRLLRLVCIGAVCFLSNQNVFDLTLSFGTGSAVATVDRAATFPTLTIANTSELGAYSENGLSITTGNQNWGADPPPAPYVLNPFHIDPTPSNFYAVAWANAEWVTIQTTDAKPIFGLEFMYGNTWTTGDLSGNPPYSPWGRYDATFEYQEWRGGTMVDSGSVAFLGLATIVGFYDSAGFDQLLVRATTASNGSTNAIALANVSAQLSAVPLAVTVTGLAREGNDIRITWETVGGKTNFVQASKGVAGGYSTNFTNISAAIICPGTTYTVTNYLDVSGATNAPVRFYRVRLVP